MHIRAGQDAKLSSELKLEGEPAQRRQVVPEVARARWYWPRPTCSKSSATSLASAAAAGHGIDIFVAADIPEALRPCTSFRTTGVRPRSPSSTSYGYGERRARCASLSPSESSCCTTSSSCSVAGFVQVFILLGFRNYYRKRAGRLTGKGAHVNGCADDGDLQEAVTSTSATAAGADGEHICASGAAPEERARVRRSATASASSMAST